MGHLMFEWEKYKNAWEWLKENWQIPFIFGWTFVVWVLTRRNSEALIEVLEAKNESHKKQIKILKETHMDELLKRDQLLETYQQTVEKIKRDFEFGKLKLSQEQEEEIKKFVVDSNGNPDEIREKIESTFGFTYTD